MKKFYARPVWPFAFLLTGVLAARVHAAPMENIIATGLEDAASSLQKIPHPYLRSIELLSISTSLARLGKTDAALKIARRADAASRLDDKNAKPQARDEVWRITSRRLAWQGNLPAAMRSANRIGAEYSRADALLSIARAHLRNGDVNAGHAIFKSVMPVIRQTKSPRALSYLAFLFARSGDEKIARELLSEARIVKDPNSMEQYGMPDHRKSIVATYQAKIGWGREAFETAGNDTWSLSSVKAVLRTRHDWQPLLDYAAKLPALSATHFLLELSTSQLQNGEVVAARSTLKMAKTRYEVVNKKEKQTEREMFTELFIAIHEIALGEEAEGRARYEAIKTAPTFSPEIEATFHFALLIYQPLTHTHPTSDEQRAKEDAALASLYKMSFGSDRVSNILDIARIQQKRGDQTALHKTLQRAHDAIRMNLVSPLEREKKNSLRSHRYGAAWSLVQVAVLERDAGDEHSSQSTLDQVMTLLQTRSPDEIASILLINGFTDEAARQLERFVAAPTTPAFMAIKTTEANGWNPLARLAAHHAKTAGVNNAMRWVLKISDMSLRAKCLTAIATMLSPLPAEEREFILSGDKAGGANIGASIRVAGYNASYNFDEGLN